MLLLSNPIYRGLPPGAYCDQKSLHLTYLRTRQRPSMFAVIIGIDKYKDPAIPDLCGAVADAEAFRQYLVNHVGVEQNRIVYLRDEEATKDAMIHAIHDLATNQEISAQDPILIYYAGHGSEAPLPSSKRNQFSSSVIEMLVPCDFVANGSATREGQGLFDISLYNLLDEIARQKSDNITVIFDCCHSGSGTRTNTNDESVAIRAIQLGSSYTFPISLIEQEISCERVPSIPIEYEKIRLRSHVLLAACMRGQHAVETQGHGAFTTALLTLLKRERYDRLTYQDVIIHLQELPSQNPRCEGMNQSRILFTAEVAHRSLYCIRSVHQTSGEYTLDSGPPYGVISQGDSGLSSNEIHTSMPSSAITCGTASIVGGIPLALSDARAAGEETRAEGCNIQRIVQANDVFLEFLFRIGQSDNATVNFSFCLVDNARQEPDLVVSVQDSRVQFYITSKICRQYGLTRMPFDNITVDETKYLFSILCSAADFYWYLNHSNGDQSTSFPIHDINVQCLKLVPSGEYNDYLEQILVPDPKSRDLTNDGSIFINVDEEAIYGFTITNNSKLSLYAAFFYFDASDLSIVPYHLPGLTANGKADFSLPANGFLNVGFGDSETAPRRFYLRKNQSVDIGFLKLYLSSKYVDYSGISQGSPFSPDRRMLPRGLRQKERHCWNALTIPMIQTAESRTSFGA
ncbi:hypothetical protein HYPSUDRAFT_38219 [Hypholoma sublateritium FD-334 SS-4]|uniref:Peptidase C14 caspase domain-containing protein n=1 Tax=Hypholoma sublateritium (strain FD-334 SS-4) TaxID=945553 RepID=A0A0D2P894_HYPSF|nr:hypothetical protein HYPSUDRAFT_38219 [Hypholoma sublateritium FD-334 SS-4]